MVGFGGSLAILFFLLFTMPVTMFVSEIKETVHRYLAYMNTKKAMRISHSSADSIYTKNYYKNTGSSDEIQYHQNKFKQCDFLVCVGKNRVNTCIHQNIMKNNYGEFYIKNYYEDSNRYELVRYDFKDDDVPCSHRICNRIPYDFYIINHDDYMKDEVFLIYKYSSELSKTIFTLKETLIQLDIDKHQYMYNLMSKDNVDNEVMRLFIEKEIALKGKLKEMIRMAYEQYQISTRIKDDELSLSMFNKLHNIHI